MILVTGATGAIGGEVVRLLLEAGHQVRALVRNPAKAAALAGKVELAHGDLDKPESLRAAFEGAKKAFVMVGEIKNLPEVASHVFRTAEQAGVEHTVFLSSGTIEIDPPTQVGRWHLEGERQLKATKMKWTMLRPGNFASNTLRWAGPIKAQGTVFTAFPKHRSSVIDPRDIGAVAAAALSGQGHEEKTHFLTGPAPITVEEQVQTLSAVLGKPLKVVEVPEAGARAGMLKSGMSEVLAEAVLELQRPGTTLGPRMSTTVTDVTGRAARTFERWARDHVSAFGG